MTRLTKKNYLLNLMISCLKDLFSLEDIEHIIDWLMTFCLKKSYKKIKLNLLQYLKST